MKIMITCHSYYPRKDGVQFVTQYLAEGLVKKGHSVTVYTNLHKDNNEEKTERYHGVLIKRIDAYTKHTIHYGKKEDYVKMILKDAESNDIMINVCTQCATTDWLLKSLDKIKIPKVLYLHSIWDFKYKKENFSDLKSFIKKVFANVRWKLYYTVNGNRFKQYDVVTQLHKMDYTYSFFKKKYNIDSIIIENAAENSFFDKTVLNTISLPQKYLINVSNYADVKNQKRALKLFLNSPIPDDWELILIGSYNNKYYQQLCHIYEIYKNAGSTKKVHLLYNIPREQVSTYVKKASIYFMTSKREAFPISLVESMAAGVPFISSNVGIVKYLSGGVVCNSDEEYLYWLEEFIKNEDLRKRLGELGRSEAIKKYSVDQKVNQLEQLLTKTIHEK